jgi:1-acyl-sn-glycerol-3-phosphate acyltransferase
LGTDLVERTVITALLRLRPATRERILTTWARAVASWILILVRSIGCARIGPIPTIPGEPGVLILMNHQSLFDIPVAIRAVTGTYPRIVTRRRYARRIPLISHMLRLYEHPLVDPDDRSREQLHSLIQVARETKHPLVIFPEGTRTRNGNIQSFRRPGLRVILRARPWKVYLLVVDGFWRCAHFKEFARNVGGVNARIACVGPIPWDDPKADTDAFGEKAREIMVTKLEELRRGPGHDGRA